jgi:hypothetical protein
MLSDGASDEQARVTFLIPLYVLCASWLLGSPFSNYQIPAVVLLVCVAGGNLTSAALLWRHRDFGISLSMAAGVVLMVFETASLGLRNVQQPLMFVIGLLIAGLALVLWRQDKSASSLTLSAHIGA